MKLTPAPDKRQRAVRPSIKALLMKALADEFWLRFPERQITKLEYVADNPPVGMDQQWAVQCRINRRKQQFLISCRTVEREIVDEENVVMDIVAETSWYVEPATFTAWPPVRK